MKPITKLILLLIILMTGIMVWKILRNAQSTDATTQVAATSTPVYETKENQGGNVTASVTPIRLTPGFPASFDVAFETHSVDLSFDVDRIATLTDNAGGTYRPHWDGSPPGGHHRKGILRFTPDLPRINSVTLTFTDIAGVPTRTLTWEVKHP